MHHLGSQIACTNSLAGFGTAVYGLSMHMDKSAFSINTFKSAADHQAHYRKLSPKEHGEVFLMLMRSAYGLGNSTPKMEKVFSGLRRRDHARD